MKRRKHRQKQLRLAFDIFLVFGCLLGILSLIAQLVGCSSIPFDGFDPPNPNGCDKTYLVAPGFSDDERAALNRANQRWNAIANRHFCLEDAPSAADEHSIRRIPYQGPEWQAISKDFGGSNVLGVYTGRADNIVIIDGMTNSLFELVALHELGHAHGLGHVASPGIMHDSVGTANDFTPNDLAECSRVGACGESVVQPAEPCVLVSYYPF